MPTPYDETRAALKDAVAVLGRYAPADADADALLDRIVRLVEPRRCEYHGAESEGIACGEPAEVLVESYLSGGLLQCCASHREQPNMESPAQRLVSCPNCCCLFCT